MKTAVAYSVILRSRPAKGGRRRFFLDITRQGKRYQEALHLFLEPETRANKRINEQATAEAMQVRQLRENELKEAILGLDVQGDGYGTSVLAYIEDEIARRKAEGKSVRVMETLLFHLKLHVGSGDLLFCDVNARWVQGFKMYLMTARRQSRYGEVDGTLSRNSAATYYARFRTMMKLAFKQGLIRRNPMDSVAGVSFRESERQFLTREELRALMGAACEHEGVRRAFLFSCMTGLRYQDVAALRWRNVVRDGTEVIVRFRQNKTDSMVYDLPLSRMAVDQLPDEGGPEDVVFRIPANSHCNDYIAAWCKAAGIKKHITFHCARHTFATGLLTSGTDLYTTSKLLGHKSVITTQIYGKIVDEKRRKAVDALDKFVNE